MICNNFVAGKPMNLGIGDENTYPIEMIEKCRQLLYNTHNNSEKTAGRVIIMMKVELQYNPYWVQTKLSIDGNDVAQEPRYGRFQRYMKDIPLQTWLEPIPGDDWLGLPAELEKLGRGGLGVVSIQFTGRQVDYDDLKAAAQRQRKDAQFEFPNPQIVLKDEDMDGLLRKGMEEIRSPRFAALLDRPCFKAGSELRKKYDGLETEFNKVRNREFRIVFAGLYSSGKSTLLNALMHKQLLPMADGTCTAKVFRIEHKNDIAVAEMCYMGQEQKELVPWQYYDNETALMEKLSELQKEKNVEEVYLRTDLSHLYPEGFEDKFKLVLVDTPGTNSGIGNDPGEEITHHEIATKAIVSNDKEMVILIVSAGNEQEASITELLDEIDEALKADGAYDQRFLFVLNKCDNPRYANGESLERKIRIYREYISGSRDSLKSPRIFPTAAQAALAIRSGITDNDAVKDQNSENLYDGYCNLKKKCTQKFGKENYLLEKRASVPGIVAEEIAHELKQAEDSGDESQAVLFHSGLPSLECSIQAYIARYAYPLKVQALLKTFHSIFTEMREWNKVCAREFEQAEKLWGEAGEQKKEREQEKEARDSRKKQLENAKACLDVCTDAIDRIGSDQTWVKELTDLKAEVALKTFGPILDKLGNGGNEIIFSSPSAAAQFGKALKNTFEDGTNKANQKMKQVSEEISLQVNGVFQEGNKALNDLKESGALNIDGFDLTKTVAFTQITNGLKINVNTQEVMAANPIKQKKFKPWQIFDIIGQFFAPDQVKTTVFKVDVRTARNGVYALQKEFDQACDTLLEDCRAYVDKTKKEAKKRIMDVKRCLDEVSGALDKTKRKISELAEDQAKYKEEKRQIGEDIDFLNSIQNILKGCLPLDQKGAECK